MSGIPDSWYDEIEGVPVARCVCGGIMAWGQLPGVEEPEWTHIAPTDQEKTFGIHTFSEDYQYILVTREMYNGWTEDHPKDMRKKLNYLLYLEDCEHQED